MRFILRCTSLLNPLHIQHNAIGINSLHNSILNAIGINSLHNSILLDISIFMCWMTWYWILLYSESTEYFYDRLIPTSKKLYNIRPKITKNTKPTNDGLKPPNQKLILLAPRSRFSTNIIFDIYWMLIRSYTTDWKIRVISRSIDIIFLFGIW